MTTPAFIPFDLLRSPLQGTNLIEAGAGTGKTYAIAGLFVRLLLETSLTVGRILVVTYTVAATEELRDRIRSQIREAAGAFAAGGSTDPFLGPLVKGHPRPEEAIRLLRAALRDFDEAPIHTIHSFCQRTLLENAFESGSLFDTELITDEGPIIEEIVQDFWRRHFYGAQPEFAAYALANKGDLPSFLKLIRHRSADPSLRLVPDARPVPLRALDAFRETFREVADLWPRVREAALEGLRDDALKGNVYRDPEALVAQMDFYMASGTGIPLFPGFEKFTAPALEKNTKKQRVTPRHPFFDLCERHRGHGEALLREMDGQLLFLRREIFRFVEQELPARKGRLNIQAYDDLLQNVRRALESRGGAGLAEALRGRYGAALIDEFQDTDPTQYAIFQMVFGGGAGTLFLIGDPKQAIYSFRGADLFAYIRASQQVGARYTLTRNWRSEPGLIAAVNAVFGAPAHPFLYEEIPFAPAMAGRAEGAEGLTICGRSEAPLRIWLLGRDQLAAAGADRNKDRTREIIAEAVAGEITHLLGLGREDKARIGERPLREGDMAVLVRTNHEARLIQDALRRHGVPAVLHSAGNLFDTPEALEMERILGGIAEPNTEGRLRTALATDMMGQDGAALEALRQDEARWEGWIARFRAYNELWEQRGFIAMFRQVLLQERVRERLLSFPDGERRLTNVLHLAEILQTEAGKGRHGMAGLQKWLSRQRDQRSPRLEEHELRLESDALAVRIVTIHKSKGLEYPVVFCPFNWGPSRVRKGGVFSYHDEADNWRPCLVIDPTLEGNRPAAEREALAENMRLLYVALTRAKHRCYVVWGLLKDAGTSALAYALHPPREGGADVVGIMEERFKTLTDEDIRRDLDALILSSGGTIGVSGPPAPRGGAAYEVAPGKPRELTGRVFAGAIERDRRIASFSYLLAGRAHPAGLPLEAAADLADHDGGAATLGAPPEELAGIFAFPRGARAGSFLHAVFEHLDFTGGDPAARGRLVTAKLREYGFDDHWRDTLCRMIGHVLAAPLDPEIRDLTLSGVAAGDRLSELGFYFPLKIVKAETLRRVFAEGGRGLPAGFAERLGRLEFRPARGFMKGYMDLVFQHDGRFYLVDWKSNFLGGRIEDYKEDRLATVMAEEFYVLQYHLYGLALHQYLKVRLPGYAYDRHFGGVFYIFLRGVDPKGGPACGIYRDRPDRAMMDLLCRNLIE